MGRSPRFNPQDCRKERWEEEWHEYAYDSKPRTILRALALATGPRSHPEKDGSQEILLFGWTCLGGNMTPYGPTSGSLSLANEE